MVHVIQGAHWWRYMGGIIRNAADGDIIVVENALKAKLAEKSLLTQCPKKSLQIQIDAVAMAS